MPSAATSSIAVTVASSTEPKTVYAVGNPVLSAKTMKNCEPLVFGPALAMARAPAVYSSSP